MKFRNVLDLYPLIRNPWKTPEEVRRIQDVKLQRLVRHAYSNVPYYRRLFDSVSLRPEDVRGVNDLRHLPLTSKKEMNELPLSEITARGVDPARCRISATSGTTGIPLRIYLTPFDSTAMSLGWARAFLSRGMKPWDRIGMFIGKKRDGKKEKSWYERLGIWRKREISNWDTPEAWIRTLRAWTPQILIGYEMSLRILSEAVLKFQVKEISPKRIFHSSGILEDSWRNFIESALQTQIVDIYGSDEAGCIAWECDQCSAYHISSDMVVVEILKNGKPVPQGQEGQIAITNLHSCAMPFIRYVQGDVGNFSLKKPCCKRGFPLMDRIQGREDDFIYLKSGRKMSPQPFYHCIDPVPGIRRWKICQDDLESICVTMEPGAAFTPQTAQVVKNNLKRLVEEEAAIQVSVVKAIPVDPFVKFRAVSSRVEKDAEKRTH